MLTCDRCPTVLSGLASAIADAYERLGAVATGRLRLKQGGIVEERRQHCALRQKG